jgi:hypothetical protein
VRGRVEITGCGVVFAVGAAVATGSSTLAGRGPSSLKIALAEEAVRASPDEAIAHYVLGTAWKDDGVFARARGHDGRASYQRAVAAQEEALRIDPRFVWALQDLLADHHLSFEID